LQARTLAFYLPQFHPIPENDEFWGPGFTEWVNVAQARPLFRGHHQPNLPGELGFYDLRLSETRAAQAALANEYGVEGFVYWHYWFAGRRVLERPVREVVESGEPHFPFALAWANQSWTGIWHGAPERVLIEQTYPGPDDYRRHFEAVLPALSDHRYVTVDGRPLFIVFRPRELPDADRFCEQWRSLADNAGLPGVYLVGIDDFDSWDPRADGFDAAIAGRTAYTAGLVGDGVLGLARHLLRGGEVGGSRRSRLRPPLLGFDYAEQASRLIPRSRIAWEAYPSVVPRCDTTPRMGRRGSVWLDSTPDRFAHHVREALATLQDRPDDRRLLFVESWNEWAEGTQLEPDRRWGRAYLQALSDALA
jgi:hypothetical protein